MGSNFPVYQDGAIQALYPAFISKKFDKKYIASNALNVIIDDLYNARTLGKP